jgi:hypothetical protein
MAHGLLLAIPQGRKMVVISERVWKYLLPVVKQDPAGG